jgi:putative endonuclease
MVMTRGHVGWLLRGYLLVKTHSCPSVGRAGEAAARIFLRRQGLIPVAANWRGREGELDLVGVTRDNVLVFVEVKTTLGAPEAAWERIDSAKEARLETTAQQYLLAHGLRPSHPRRFDVVLVSGDPRSLKKPVRFLWAQDVL